MFAYTEHKSFDEFVHMVENLSDRTRCSLIKVLKHVFTHETRTMGYKPQCYSITYLYLLWLCDFLVLACSRCGKIGPATLQNHIPIPMFCLQ